MRVNVKRIFDLVIENKARRTIAFMLALVVTFTTSYALILPAITLERDTAETSAGIDLGGSSGDSDRSDASSEGDGDRSDDGSAGDGDQSDDASGEDASAEDTAQETVSFDAETQEETADGETRTMQVHVEAQEGAFPAGTTMEVEAVTDQTVLETVSDAVEGDVSAVHAVNITFTDENGEEVQPQEGYEVNVTMTSDAVQATDDNTAVVQYTEPEDAAAATKDTDRQSHSTESQESEPAQSEEETQNQPVQAVETQQTVDLQVEPEMDMDTDSAVTFPLDNGNGQTTYAIVETNVDNPAVGEDAAPVDSQTEETVGGEAAAEAEAPAEPQAMEQEAAAEDEIVQPQLPEQVQPTVMEQTVEAVALVEEQQYTHELTAQTEDGEFFVTAQFTDSAFYGAEVQLLVSAVEAEDYANAAIEAAGMEKEQPKVRAVDITFLDENGEEIQPAQQEMVKITIQAAFLEEAVQSEVVHMEDADNGTLVENTAAAEDTITLRTDGFSVYAIVYTVDFHFGAYEYSIQGGSSISLKELLPILGIVSEDEADDYVVNQIKDVSFSNPDLVKVIHLTPILGVFGPEDWVLQSQMAFSTEETLTITLTDDTTIVIRVTDAQMTKQVMTADGETYEITVIYDGKAQIPEGAELEVRELEAGTEEFNGYLNDSMAELGLESTDDVSLARFFDIEIIDENGNKVEPGTPVQVKIVYEDAIELGEDQQLSVVHFADKGTEIIDEVGLNTSGDTITYEQESFSVTGTIVSGGPRNGQQYMLIAEYEGKKYLINNDGTLIPVNQVDANNIKTENPMLWTYYYQYGGNFRIASEATGFDASNVAVGFYYRYIDPNVDSGLTEENVQRPNLAGSTRINYNNNLISSASNNNYYIGVSDEGGTLHIVGQQAASKAAKITLYDPSKVNDAAPANHTVNHIDISISGNAEVDVPLAYGIYYYKVGNTWHKLIVGNDVPDVHGDGISSEALIHREANHTEKLKAENIKVTSADMKGATIVAKRHDNKETIDDAFYITGYSANHSTEYSTDQVRIEGSFKVADMDPVSNWWDVNSDYTRGERLKNIIDYTVTANKKLNMPLTYTVGGQTYQLYKDPADDADQVSVVATVNMSATFNYWDHKDQYGHSVYNDNGGNECPPLQPGWGYDNEWKNGGIQPWGISGMDFVLTGTGTAEAKVLALEITKTLKFLDENGNVENVQYNQPITFNYEVFTDRPGDPSTVRVPGGEVHDYGTYKDLHGTSITVKPTTNGGNSGHVYDYDVTDGMYYVREVRNDIFQTELTIGNDTYRYVSTNIKTEYSHRHNQYRDRTTGVHQMHEVGISSDTANLNSIPEVLGSYTADDGQSETNEFLEFYFENVYQKNATPPPPEPVIKTFEINLDKKWQDGDNTTPPTTGSVTFHLYRKVVQNGTETEDTSFNNQNNTYVVSAVDGWKLTIPNLVWHETDTQNSYDRTYKYYFVEDTAQAVGADVKRYGVPSFTNGYGSVNSPVEGGKDIETVTVECTNKTGNVLRIQKRWLNVDPDVAPNVTIKLWQQELKPGGTEAVGQPQQIGTDIVLTNSNKVNGENWWQIEIPLPNNELPVYYNYGYWTQDDGYKVYDIAYGDFAYYITENSLNTQGSNDFVAPQFYKLIGDEVIDDYEAWYLTSSDSGHAQGDINKSDWNVHSQHPETYVTASEGKDGTLIVMNSPNNTFSGVEFSKNWYKYEENQLVKANPADTKNYAVGIQIYQSISGTNNWHAYAKPLYVAAENGIIDNNGKNYIMDDNNPFVFNENVKVETNDGRWHWLINANAGKRGFPTYAIVNGVKQYYTYEAREIGVYTTVDGVNKASSVDQLMRVYDYTNIQKWNFDYQNKQPKGINVEAGKLNVTKKWEGGHVGSRVYFKLFRGEQDITDSIVSNPEDYGLNEFQVVNDGTHTALIVKYDGTNWETLQIQGLPMAPSGGGTPYQYSIKEIGYSEADGTDCWDGEKVTEPDGSTRKDPHGNDVTINIGGSGGLLTGYKIDSTENMTKTEDGKSDSTPVTGSTTHTITAFNTYEEKYKDLEIKKIWTNQAGDFLTWEQNIIVDLYAKKKDGQDTEYQKIAQNILLFVTPPNEETTQTFKMIGDDTTMYKWEVSVDPSGKVYTFKFKDLPAKYSGEDAVYSVQEQTPSGDYTVSYGFITESTVTVEGKEIIKQKFYDSNSPGAVNGNVIRNMKTEEGVALPNTGGPGTKALYVAGTALVTTAVLGYGWKRGKLITRRVRRK